MTAKERPAPTPTCGVRHVIGRFDIVRCDKTWGHLPATQHEATVKWTAPDTSTVAGGWTDPKG